MPTMVCGMTFISWLRLQPRPKRRLPTHNICVVVVSTLLAVCTKRHQVIVSVCSWKAINVGMTPRIRLEILFQIGTIPIRSVGGTVSQDLKALFVRWVPAYIQLELIESALVFRNLGFRGDVFRLVDVTTYPRSNDRGEERDNHHNHEQFDQRDSGLVSRS